MKKVKLSYSVCFIVLGCAVMLIGNSFHIDGMPWGLGGIFIGIGFAESFYVIFSKKSSHVPTLKNDLELQKSENCDERSRMLHEKSGNAAFHLSLLLDTIVIIFFTILCTYRYMVPYTVYIVVGLSILLVVKFLLTYIYYQYFNNKY